MDRLRAKEARMQLSVNGSTKRDSFLKIKNFSFNPVTEVVKTKFTGEKRDRNDLRVDGYEGSFQIEEVGKDWYEVWKLFEDAERNGTPFPVVTAVITKNYRTKPRLVLRLFGEFIMTMDGNEHSEHDHTSVDFSYSCRFASAG